MVMDYCEKCVYRKTFTSAGPYCDYICMTGHRRPCPPGEGCTVRVLLDERKPKAFTVVKNNRGRKPLTDDEKTLALLATRERKRNYAREHRKNLTPEQIERNREKCRRYYERNKEKMKAKHKEWSQENQEYLNAYHRERRRKKKEAEKNGCSPE